MKPEIKLFSPELEIQSPRLEYPYKPIILGHAKELIETARIVWDKQGVANFTLTDGTNISLPKQFQIKQIDASFNTLLGNLQPGTEYEEWVNHEFQLYMEATEKDPEKIQYGELVYYPLYPRLVWKAPYELHHLAMLARSQDMIRDKGKKLTYLEIRQIFGPQIIGFIGASVNSIALHRLRDTLYLEATKTGDPDNYDDAVRSRRRFSLLGYGQNKAIFTASEIHEADPWAKVFVYPEGLDPSNADNFFMGDNLEEPGVTQIVEAIDSPEMKIEMAKKARVFGIPYWRITDIGSAYQVEYLPFDKEKDFPIGITVPDIELYQALDNFQSQPSQELFFQLAEKLVGPNQWSVAEFNDAIHGNGTTPFMKGIPQLAIASEGAASLLATLLAGSLLGDKIPNRYFVDLRNSRMIQEFIFRNNNGRWEVKKITADLNLPSITTEISEFS